MGLGLPDLTSPFTLRKIMKRLALLLVSLLTITPAAFADALPAHFVITGSGYGHGVGLSQIGAKGMALEGKSASDILSYYFTGTTVAPVQDGADIRVNIGHKLTYLSLKADKNSVSGIQLHQGELSGPLTQIPLASTLKFAMVGKVISASIVTPKAATVVLPSGALWSLTWDGNLTVNKLVLKYGSVALRAVPITKSTPKIELTTTMKLHDQYVYGVSEVSSSWPTAAMQAQAIATRTYALTRMAKIRKDCDCNVYNTIYDQNYVGASKELEATYGALWKAAVDSTTVDATHGLAILYNGQPINTFFSSSSGGVTANSVDVWGTAYPYLVSVPDPYSLDLVLNPTYSHWQRVINQADMAAAFSLNDVASLSIATRSPTNSALTLLATSSAGATSTLPVGTFKTKLKIPSSWFELASVGY